MNDLVAQASAISKKSPSEYSYDAYISLKDAVNHKIATVQKKFSLI